MRLMPRLGVRGRLAVRLRSPQKIRSSIRLPLLKRFLQSVPDGIRSLRTTGAHSPASTDMQTTKGSGRGASQPTRPNPSSPRPDSGSVPDQAPVDLPVEGAGSRPVPGRAGTARPGAVPGPDHLQHPLEVVSTQAPMLRRSAAGPLAVDGPDAAPWHAIVPPRQESAALDRPSPAPAAASGGTHRWTMARESPCLDMRRASRYPGCSPCDPQLGGDGRSGSYGPDSLRFARLADHGEPLHYRCQGDAPLFRLIAAPIAAGLEIQPPPRAGTRQQPCWISRGNCCTVTPSQVVLPGVHMPNERLRAAVLCSGLGIDGAGADGLRAKPSSSPCSLIGS
jgi:hypothetical protein